MFKPKRMLVLLAVSIGITMLLYWIDDDPPYPKFSQTIQEASIITVILFSIITGIYALVSIRKR